MLGNYGNKLKISLIAEPKKVAKDSLESRVLPQDVHIFQLNKPRYIMSKLIPLEQ